MFCCDLGWERIEGVCDRKVGSDWEGFVKELMLIFVRRVLFCYCVGGLIELEVGEFGYVECLRFVIRLFYDGLM